ncbi:MAG TPA: efflux RND transporter periplasmic adaptor subunit [Thermoanaerobaculia bacterium]|nr:efflux RND transporter periplasmic adaptor subunit [Thermoanaerobaculia bacterium]
MNEKRLDDLRIDRKDESGGRTDRRWWPLALIAVTVLVIVGWLMARPAPAEVLVAEAREVSGQGPSTVLNASGYVTARRRATVSSKVTAKVEEVLIEEGMRVEQGQLLARLDNAFQQRSFRSTEAQVSAARSALEETRVRITEARLDLDRARRLTEEEVASQSNLDKARAQVDALQARLATQEDELAVTRRQLELRRQDLEDTEIRAPFSGIVVTKDAQPGEMISPVSAGGGFTRTGICTIVDMSSLEIEVDVNEAYINRVRPSQRVEAVLDAYPDWRIPAHVITVVPTANREKATVRVRIAIDQPDPRILPDMGVKVSFIAEEGSGEAASAAVTIPRAALRRNGETDVVFVVGPESSLERRAVRVGMAMGDEVNIQSGLRAGENVVIDGPEQLEDGQRVKTIEGEQR